MARIIDLTTITPERVTQIRSTAKGSYTFDLRNIPAERLDRMSRGYTAEGLAVLSGRFVIFESRDIERDYRFFPIPEQFTEAERAALEGGSFSCAALMNYIPASNNNDLFFAKAFCADCGKKFSRIPDSHRCGETTCRRCGEVVNTDEERAARMCRTCAIEEAATLHGYHNRPNRHNPRFQRPEVRGSVLHYAPEIEMDGTDSFSRFEFCKTASAILNTNPFKPYAAFETDSSLNNGVEVILQPVTWDFYKKNAETFSRFYTAATEAGGRFGRNNGLHFHLDREFFEDSVRASVFLQVMIYKNFDFFAAISGRTRGNFSYSHKKEGAEDVLGAALKLENSDRYEAVNTTGGDTIELRFFGGNIGTGDSFLAVADLVQALARWANAASIAAADRCKPKDLARYIRDPERVLAYLDLLPSTRLKTAESETDLTAFRAALAARLA